MSDDQYKSGGVYLSLEKAPLVTFTVRCPSCQALHRAEANCGRIVFDAIGLHCSCGVDTDLMGGVILSCVLRRPDSGPAQ